MKKMKRTIISIASLLMLGALTTEAQTIKVSGTEASANGEMQIVITADASISNYIATGFFVELPEGFSVAGVEGVKGNAVQSNHVVRVGQTGNSKLRVAVYSLANSAFDLYTVPMTAGEGQSGSGGGGGRTRAPMEEEEAIPLTLCTLKLKAPNKEGTFIGQLTGVEFSTASHVLATGSSNSFNITLKSAHKWGDANMSGRFDHDDVVAIAKWIMGNYQGSFDEEAADVSNDGVVNVADIVILLKDLNGECYIDDPDPDINFDDDF